jgi:hypothetical protein
MMDSSSEFRAEVAAAVVGSVEDEARRGSENHPTLEELIAYHQGRLEDAEVDRFQEHLLVCRECLARLSELDRFVEAGERTPPEIGSLEEASAWRALRPRLTRPRLAAPSRTVSLALAASFLVAAVGLGVWAFQQRLETAQLREQVARLSRPQPAATIVELFPGSTRGSAEQPPPVDLASTDHLTVLLHLPEPPDFAAYEAEIVGTEGRELWRGGVRMDSYGTFSLGIPRSFLDAGSYRIVLYGLVDDGRRRIETFPLELVSGAKAK